MMSKMSSILVGSSRVCPFTVIPKPEGTLAAGTVTVNDCGVAAEGESEAKAVRALIASPAGVWPGAGKSWSDPGGGAPAGGVKVGSIEVAAGGGGGTGEELVLP